MRVSTSLFFGFAAFGLLIGLITGLTSSAISGAIITALFAFVGGKILLNFDGKKPGVQINIGIVILGFSLFCVTGILSGIYIKVNQVLTITYTVKSNQSPTSSKKDSGNVYLRANEAKLIELEYRRGEINKDSALQALFNLNQ